jgi:hypothetical protein
MTMNMRFDEIVMIVTARIVMAKKPSRETVKSSNSNLYGRIDTVHSTIVAQLKCGKMQQKHENSLSLAQLTSISTGVLNILESGNENRV